MTSIEPFFFNCSFFFIINKNTTNRYLFFSFLVQILADISTNIKLFILNAIGILQCYKCSIRQKFNVLIVMLKIEHGKFYYFTSKFILLGHQIILIFLIFFVT
jgi:hypothetical protein